MRTCAFEAFSRIIPLQYRIPSKAGGMPIRWKTFFRDAGVYAGLPLFTRCGTCQEEDPLVWLDTTDLLGNNL